MVRLTIADVPGWLWIVGLGLLVLMGLAIWQVWVERNKPASSVVKHEVSCCGCLMLLCSALGFGAIASAVLYVAGP